MKTLLDSDWLRAVQFNCNSAKNYNTRANSVVPVLIMYMRKFLHSDWLKPGQTLATFQRNILQHCWAQHVAYVWPPCCDMLRCVATCWMMLDQIWKRSNFSCNILDVAWCCTRLATFTQHCCARACALGPLAIATRQRNDGFLSVTMADNTAQIQQPKKKCPRKWTEGETTSLTEVRSDLVFGT